FQQFLLFGPYAETRLRARCGSWADSWRRSWSRCGGRCCSGGGRGSWSRCRRWRWRATSGSLDCNHHRRARLEEPDRGIGIPWRLIGIKPEVIKWAEADRISIGVFINGFAVPTNGIHGLSNSPWCAAVALAIKRAVVRPARFLWWRMKVDVTCVYSGAQRHTERLDRAIQVHVVQGILVVPNSGGWSAHLVAHEPDAIVSRIRLDLIHYGAHRDPGRDSRLHSNRGGDRAKAERRSDTSYAELAIRNIIIHVELFRI